jgi:hypothetical protein
MGVRASPCTSCDMPACPADRRSVGRLPPLLLSALCSRARCPGRGQTHRARLRPRSCSGNRRASCSVQASRSPDPGTVITVITVRDPMAAVLSGMKWPRCRGLSVWAGIGILHQEASSHPRPGGTFRPAGPIAITPTGWALRRGQQGPGIHHGSATPPGARQWRERGRRGAPLKRVQGFTPQSGRAPKRRLVGLSPGGLGRGSALQGKSRLTLIAVRCGNGPHRDPHQHPPDLAGSPSWPVTFRVLPMEPVSDRGNSSFRESRGRVCVLSG